MGKEDLAGILVARCICIDAFALMKACVISVFMICIWEKQVKGSNKFLGHYAKKRSAIY